MPGNERIHKPPPAKSLSVREKSKPASPEERNRPVIGHERRTHIRRSGEAADLAEDAMDVALGTEGEAWERRRGDRRKKAA